MISRVRSKAENCKFGLLFSDCEHVKMLENPYYTEELRGKLVEMDNKRKAELKTYLDLDKVDLRNLVTTNSAV